MKYLPDISYSDIDKGIEYLQNNKINFPNNNHQNKTIFHVYWYGKLDRKQICCINSYLKTQNLKNTELWVWLDYLTYDSSQEKLFNHPNIKIKKYFPQQESKNTPFENKKFINHLGYIKFRSDIARLLFLYNYGGIYYDLDMILIKDLTPLLGIEFCYSWADLKRSNNGILRLFVKSKNCKIIMNKYYEDIPKNNDTNKIIFTEDLNIYCLPSLLFDPVWILHDRKKKSKYSQLSNFDDFFKETPESIDRFFNNQIFAYHWHSRSNNLIEKNSYFEKLENSN